MSEENIKADTETTFRCSNCTLAERYDYKGRQPPFARLVRFTNDCYTIADPFSPPNRGQFLILGSDCSLCSRPFCQAPQCSLFYAKFYCLQCAKQNIHLFPTQLHMRLKPNK